MDIEIEAWWHSIEAGIGLLPSALIAVALLAGPSAAWLLYRFAVQPRTSRYRVTQMGALWICAGCRSANELGSSRCYRCSQEFDDTQLEVIDSVPGGSITILPPAVSAVPRHPDLPTEPRPAIAAAGRDPVAVGPGKPKVRASKPKVGSSKPKVGSSEPQVGSSKPKVGSSKPKVGSSKPKAERPGAAKVDRPRRPVAAGRSAPKPSEPRTQAER